MALYGSAKAPAVPRYETNTTVGHLPAVEVANAEVADINAALAEIVAYLNNLIDHLNDGRR